jgi:acyl-CoA dehydrogenase
MEIVPMTVTTATSTPAFTPARPVPVQPDDDRYVELAAQLGQEFAPLAAEHDRENTFVAANFARLKESGYTRLAVPEELGGLGASMRQVCYAQAELAKWCASTALAVNMHLYVSLLAAFSRRRGAAPAERLLRRLGEEGLIAMTSGGSDGIWPSATAERVDGGYSITGRKIFCSQAPVADILTTMAAYDDPDEGRIVLMFGIPTTSEGFEIIETWDTLGMRATSSHDTQLNGVFASDAQVSARRPWGSMDPVLRGAGIHFAPTVASVYWGVAAGARDEAVRVVTSRRNPAGESAAADPTIQRQVGVMDHKLRLGWWGLLGGLNELGNDYGPTAQAVDAGMIAKRQIITDAVEIVDIAMEVVGGLSYFRRSPLERAYRDVRAGKYHPMTPEKTLLHTGRLALGQGVETIW